MNFFLAQRAVSYWLFSRHRKGHGIHSPYIFNLFSEIFENKPDRSVVKTVENSRERFLNRSDSVVVHDLGSGSLKMGEGRRRVSDIARHSSVKRRYVGIISALAGMSDGRAVIELGTSLGLGTMAMALSAPNSKVITIEGCPDTAAIAMDNFSRLGISNIDTRIGDIGLLLEPILKETGSPGLVFIDANHRFEPLLSYYNTIADHATDGTIVVIDDIHLTPGMEKGWEIIKGNRKTGPTIDIFQMGMVLFREGMRKEDYLIRY